MTLRILPDLGAVKLSDVQRADVQTIADRMLAKNLDPSTIRNAIMPLRVVFRRALTRGEVAVNPTTGLELPAVRGTRDRIVTPAEAATLVTALPDLDRALWATAFYGGLRLGELRALKWTDVDLEANVIRVERGWDHIEGEIEAKSRAGRRTVPMAKVLREHLVGHRLRSGRVHGYVFGLSADRPFNPTSTCNKPFTLVERARRYSETFTALVRRSRLMNDRTIGRAGFLGILGAGALGLFFAKDVGGFLDRIVPSSVSSLVPTVGWRIYTVGAMPNIDPAAYRLRVDGLVESPQTFTLAELKALPRAEQVSDFQCVTGWKVSNVRWAGVRIKDVLGEVGKAKGAVAMTFVSAEVPYSDSLTVQQALLPDVMLAYEMDGKPLSRAHGAPVRLVMPQMYGYKSVKWVNHIELGRIADFGYWEQNGYDKDAWIGRSNGFGV